MTLTASDMDKYELEYKFDELVWVLGKEKCKFKNYVDESFARVYDRENDGYAVVPVEWLSHA